MYADDLKLYRAVNSLNDAQLLQNDLNRVHRWCCDNAWSTDEGEKETHFRLTLSKMSARHSDQYTCTSPGGHTNTITIKVVSVTCPPLNASSPRLRQFTQGTKLGHVAHFSCQPGFHLNGSAVLTCMGDGRWSFLPPTCEETFCPMLGSLGAHLSVVEYNSSFGGRAVFQCAWGYRLVGAPGLECEQDGTWSGAVPQCTRK
ncbi:locomotion-related protein Hikaru genki-like [Hyposmocoma kahamanoa]|uniref:locomotion-related protein Hikaru genki-like n=1 Tax=Hyposmocoma kahamanoa TaxID=1477025 RepID=UPI000E6D938E|nr:locomotion-related protein Hikaru genki-like [Hyposmocoma kahamanoa]